jgi:hypothetical protein
VPPDAGARAVGERCTDDVWTLSLAVSHALLGKHIGKTDPLVRETVTKALGGVLFIDEAYMLASPSSRDYGREAVATLIELMETHREDLIIIFAGYEAEIQKLLDSNPGLRSRVPAVNIVRFPKFTLEEALDALCLMAESAKIDVDPLCYQIWYDLSLILKMPTSGREVRNLFEALLAGPAADRAYINNRALRIEPEDFAYVLLSRRRPNPAIPVRALALPTDDEVN